MGALVIAAQTLRRLDEIGLEIAEPASGLSPALRMARIACVTARKSPSSPATSAPAEMSEAMTADDLSGRAR